MILGKNIRYLRKKQGLSQDKLADILGYKSFTTIQKWESGVAEPPFNVLAKLSSIFNVNIDDLAKVDLSASDNASSDESSSELDMFEERLVSLYRELNEEGRRALLSQADIMTNMDTYNKDNKPEFYHCEDVCTDRLTDKRKDKMAG